MNNEIYGYYELPEDQSEEHKKRFVSEIKDGKLLFPFTRQRTSSTDYVYLMIPKPKRGRPKKS